MRNAFLVVLTLAVVPAFAQQAPPADSTLALPTEWETYYVVFLQPGSAAGQQEPEAMQALMDRHIQYQLRLQADGRAVAAGGLAPDSSSSLIGITLLRAGSLEEAQAWARADPAVAAGHFVADVRPWYVPAGRLPDR